MVHVHVHTYQMYVSVELVSCSTLSEQNRENYYNVHTLVFPMKSDTSVTDQGTFFWDKIFKCLPCAWVKIFHCERVVLFLLCCCLLLCCFVFPPGGEDLLLHSSDGGEPLEVRAVGHVLQSEWDILRRQGAQVLQVSHHCWQHSAYPYWWGQHWLYVYCMYMYKYIHVYMHDIKDVHTCMFRAFYGSTQSTDCVAHSIDCVDP